MNQDQGRVDAQGKPSGGALLEGVSLLDLAQALRCQWRLFLAISIVGVALALTYALNVQRYFSAVTVIMPPQQQHSSSAAALAQFGALSGLAAFGGGAKTPDELYIALLKSRSLQDALIKRHELLKRYRLVTMTDARMVLGKRVAVTSDRKSGLITVIVDDEEAKFAALLTNSHVEELRKMLSTLAVTEAQQRRMFFEQQVSKSQQALGLAERRFRELQARSGLIVTEALAEGGVKASLELRAQIAEREVRLLALSQFATGRNPAVQRLNAELAALRQQLNRLESGSGVEVGNSGGYEAVNAYRDMKVLEAALDALIKQFEMAKLDESREGPLLQQVDVAIPPEYPSKPKRSSIVIAGALASGILAAVIAIAREFAMRRRTAGPRSPSHMAAA